MAPITPYTADLAGRDPLAAMRDSSEAISGLVSGWSVRDFERSYAPGKWTARQVLIHLAQSEFALGTRARMALTTPNYTAQPFDQDTWMAREQDLSGLEAALAFVAASRMNTVFFAGLSSEDRQTPFAHPEYGALTVDWVIHQMAGHQIHHLKQLQVIA